jgi:gamma-glutamylcyclotransferase (GGCT)/AIG2-like uncharacterized protein YtfP
MPLYFAYGANMDRQAMAERCPRSRALGRARLARHRLFVMAEGYVSVASDPRASVHGVLWDLAQADVAALDRFEEVGRGLYKKIVQPVLREPVGSVRALVYVGATAIPGAARPSYLDGVITAARAWELPAAYVAYLESLAETPRSASR